VVTSPARVLVVCTGNVCRSPFLERALQHELDRSWGPGHVEVRSAGTGALSGRPMEDQARTRLEALGYAADGFVARQVSTDLLAPADLVLTATRAHRGRVLPLHPAATRRVFTIREFADLVGDVPEGELERPGETAVEHVRRVVRLVGEQRGVRPPLPDDLADVIDPYRRPDEVFDAMARQVTEALPALVRALGHP